MTLLTNQVTDRIRQSVDRKDHPFDIQSMHVSKDGKKALLLGRFEDLDFPEVFIYSDKSGKARRVNSESAFIDVPLGKAFWAANGRDFYMNCYDDETIYKVELDSRTYRIKQFEEVEPSDDYIQAMLREVLDLIRDDNNPPDAVAPPVIFENRHHEFLVKLLDGFKIGIEARRKWLRLFWSNYEPEVAEMRAKEAMVQFRGHYMTMEDLKRTLGVDLDTSGISEELDKLEALYRPPAEKEPQ